MNTTMQKVGTTLDDHRTHPSNNAWKKKPARKAYDHARIAKLMEEVGELLMCENKDEYAAELADCFIILLDIAYCNDIDIDAAIDSKLQALREKWA